MKSPDLATIPSIKKQQLPPSATNRKAANAWVGCYAMTCLGLVSFGNCLKQPVDFDMALLGSI
jgi:hypothetical protein